MKDEAETKKNEAETKKKPTFGQAVVDFLKKDVSTVVWVMVLIYILGILTGYVL